MSFSGSDAMRQAPMTVEEYLIKVCRMLEDQFGKGYAAKNPHLVAALVAACVADFDCAMRNTREDHK